MATLASLTVNLLARTNRFTQPLRGAERAVQNFTRTADRAEKSLRRLDGATHAARKRFLAMTAALGVATKQAADYADSILAVHKQTGLAVESTQALRYAASQSHTDIATFEKGMRAFVRRAAEAAQGNASMAKGFDRLGVDVLDAHGRLKDTETLLMEVADGAARVGSEADASAALMMVMGDAGRRLVPFMQMGSSGIRELMDEAERMGLIMDQNAIATLGALGDQASLTSNRLGAMTRDMAYRFSPAVSLVLGWVNELIDSFFNLDAEQRQNIVRWMTYTGLVLGAVAAIGVLAKVLASGIGVLRVFGVGMSFVFSPLVLYIALALAAIGTFAWAWEEDWKGIRTAVTGAWEKIEPIWNSMKTWVVNKAGDAWEWITTTTWAEKLENAKTLLQSGWKWTVDRAGDGWDWIKRFLPDEVAEFAEAKLRLLVEPFGEFYNAIKTGLETGDWSGIWGAAGDVWRAGIKLYVTLSLLSGAAQAVLGAITSGLGVASAGAGALGSFGAPGVLGVLSVAIALMEAKEKGTFEEFGANMIAALAAGIGAGVVLGPYAGGLAFTIFLNFKIGEWIGQKIGDFLESEVMSNIRGFLGTGPSREGQLLMEPQMYGDREAYYNPLPQKRVWYNPKTWFGGSYAEGTPWTGWGPTDEVAGVVHRREAVIPWSALKRGPAGVLDFLGVPGFQGGKEQGVLRSALESSRPALEALRPGLTDAILQGLDMLGKGFETGKGYLDELLQAIEEGPKAIDDAIRSMRDYQEEVEQAARQQAALNGFLSQLIGRMPVLNSALQGMEAGAGFGPIGSVVGALVALAMQSETAATAFELINEILGVAADTIGMLLEPLLPLIEVLRSVLVPVFGVIGQILRSVFLPIMPFVFEAFKLVGIAVLFVAEVFQRVRAMILDAVGGLVEGLGRAIDSLPFVSAKGIIQAGQRMRQSAAEAAKSADELADARRDLIGLTYEEAMARARNTEELTKATGALLNIPSGFKYALARFDAATARPAPADVRPSPAAPVHPRTTSDVDGAVGLTGKGDVHYHLHGDVYGWEDFKRRVKQADAENERDSNLTSYGFAGGRA